jgi:hypothetical protein
MSRINAETLSLEGIRKETGFSFCDLIDVGPAEGSCNSLSQIRSIPSGLNGLYVVWVAIGDQAPIAVYGGKCAADGEGIRHRIRVEFYYKENARSQQGPFRVNQHLKSRDQLHSFYVTYVEFGADLGKEERESFIEDKELEMLTKIDFIANYTDNGPRRLEALDAFCGAATTEPNCPPVSVAVAAAAGAAEAPSVPTADAATDLAAENAALRARLAAVERENAELRALAARRREISAQIKEKSDQLVHLKLAPALFSTLIAQFEREVAELTAECLAIA